MEAGAVGEAAGNLRVPMAVTTRKGHAANGCAVSAAAEAIGAAVLTIARASCWYVAGQGMPCPYNGVCIQRWCISFNGSLYEPAALT